MLGRRWVCALLVLLTMLAGCSGGGGILRLPKGDISISALPAGTKLNGTATAPYVVNSAFSVAVSETDFSGPYNVQMYSFHDNFNIPCFEPHLSSNGTIVTFEPDNAGLAGSPNPCAGNDDVETALITDGKGHDVYFSFELESPITKPSATPTPVASPSPGSSGSPGTACMQGDPDEGSVVVTGSVQPISFPPCNDFTVTGTLPANGAANDGLAFATSDTTTFGVTPDTAAGTAILSLELEPGPSEIALSNPASSLTVFVQSASQLGGGSYTLELSENGTVIEEVTQLTPSSNSIAFNLAPTGGVFDVAEYVAVLYKK